MAGPTAKYEGRICNMDQAWCKNVACQWDPCFTPGVRDMVAVDFASCELAPNTLTEGVSDTPTAETYGGRYCEVIRGMCRAEICKTRPCIANAVTLDLVSCVPVTAGTQA